VDETLAERPRVAVILAAGAGSRYDKIPKALLRVHGTRLIERTILALSAAGVERFIVVTGAFESELEIVPRLPRLRELRVELVHCPTWSEGNAHSLAEGAAHAGGAFYLAMADHVFDPAIVKALGAAYVEAPDDVHLATDTMADVFDLDDATKVETHDGRIVEIGKELASYDRVDVGVFVCPPWVADIAATEVANGARSVSQVMQRAIDDGHMRSVPIDGQVWQDVDTAAMRAEAERRLLASTRKSTDGPVSRWLNRPVSLAMTRVLARFDVRPNSVTTFVFVLGILAAALVMKATPCAFITAAIVTQLASVIDGCDGELARVNLRGSAFGAWYDTITDNIRYTLMVISAGVALYRTSGSEAYLIAVAVFVVGAAYLVLTMIKYLRQHRASGTHLVIVARVEAMHSANASVLTRLLFRLRFIVKQDVLALLAAIAFALQCPELVLVGGLLAVGAMIFFVDRAVAEVDNSASGTRVVFGLAGAGLLAWLLVNAPFGEIGATLGNMGPGVILVIPIVLAWSLANTLGLRELLAGRVVTATLFVNRLVGDSYNAIVPAAGLAGEPVRISMLRRDVPLAEATAAIITDRLINMVASLLVSAVAFTLAAGTLALPTYVTSGLLAYAIVALVAATLLVVVVVHGAAGALATRIARLLNHDATTLGTASPRSIMIAIAWHVIGRLLACLEVALYVALLGVPLSPFEILFVTGVLHAVGVVGFMIPQGLGIAELGAVHVFQLLGHDPTLGLAFGLVRRARVLAFSALGILVHVYMSGDSERRWRPCWR